MFLYVLPINEVTAVGSGGSTENSTKLPAGQNTFPFSFLLPANLPSSFEGKFLYLSTR